MASWQASELRKAGESDEAFIDRLADEVIRLNDELLCHSEALLAISTERDGFKTELDRVGWSPAPAAPLVRPPHAVAARSAAALDA